MTAEVRKRLAEIRMKSRTALYRWLWENRDEIAPMVSGKRAPWTALAKLAADSGIRTGRDTLPTKQMVHRTWQAVRRDLADMGATSQPTPAQPVAVPRAAPPPAQHRRIAVEIETDPDDDSEFDRPARVPT